MTERLWRAVFALIAAELLGAELWAIARDVRDCLEDRRERERVKRQLSVVDGEAQ